MWPRPPGTGQYVALVQCQKRTKLDTKSVTYKVERTNYLVCIFEFRNKMVFQTRISKFHSKFKIQNLFLKYHVISKFGITCQYGCVETQANNKFLWHPVEDGVLGAGVFRVSSDP